MASETGGVVMEPDCDEAPARRKRKSRKTGKKRAKKAEIDGAEAPDAVAETAAEPPEGADRSSADRGSAESAVVSERVAPEGAEATTDGVAESEEEPEGLHGVRLRQVLEALLFASSEPLTLRRLNRMLKEATKSDIQQEILVLEGELATDDARGYSLIQDAGGFRLLTRPELAPFVARLRGERKRIRLSKAAFETLAIIAYRQPIRRADLDSIRGVQSGTIVKNLMEWNLVGVAGRDESIGRALLYGTTEEFLDQFGLTGLEELPDPAAFLELGSSSGVVVTEEVTGPGPESDVELGVEPEELEEDAPGGSAVETND